MKRDFCTISEKSQFRGCYHKAGTVKRRNWYYENPCGAFDCNHPAPAQPGLPDTCRCRPPHERWDGRAARGITGEELPIEPDVWPSRMPFDAITSVEAINHLSGRIRLPGGFANRPAGSLIHACRAVCQAGGKWDHNRRERGTE